MKRKELIDHLNLYLEIEKFSDFGPNGLQVEGKEEVKKIATAVSANLLTIEEAAKQGVDMLIVHHGMFWARDSYVVEEAKKKKLELLLEHGITLAAYHLPLDGHQVVGNNWKAAQDLGWRNLEMFGDYGVQGELEAIPIESFVKKLEEYYGHKAHAALFGKKEVRSATLISGGAWREMLKTDTDCFITGNFDEPAWGWAQERGMHFLALGHSATEQVGPKALAKYIEEAHRLPAHFINIENPF
ncbi:MAG: Nif3-like dinuclear metal center hexameric protein [Chlamydiales bacterium]|nr:Nif3-like dinuclear metal center hexameric protein [Chlamydiales bacterium]